jgi:ubiquitin carboxyl-terminal hydrolase 5/13
MPGFSANAYRRAACAVGNSDSNAAVNWLLNHAEDADINDPLPDPGREDDGRQGGGAPGAPVDTGDVTKLQDMGFTELQARAGLLARGGAMDAAVAWLFDQGDGLDAAVEKVLTDADSTSSIDRSAVRIPRAYFECWGCLVAQNSWLPAFFEGVVSAPCLCLH